MAIIFVNAGWSDTRSTITWGGTSYSVQWIDADDVMAGKNSANYYSTPPAGNYAYYASDLQSAINFAKDGADTIVFYNVGGAEAIADFDFTPQGRIYIDKDLTFKTGSSSATANDYYDQKGVKLDALEIKKKDTDGEQEEFAEATFSRGIYSLEDVLTNKGTLRIINKATFNADLVQNDENGVILADTSSRFVASSIDAGSIVIKTALGITGITDQKRKWIERPFAVRIGDEVDVYFEGATPANRLTLGKNHVFNDLYVWTTTEGTVTTYHYDITITDPGSVSNLYRYHVNMDDGSVMLLSDVFA